MFTSSLWLWTVGECHDRLRAFGPGGASSRGVARVGRDRHPRVWFAAAPPGGPRKKLRRLLPGRRGSGHRGTRKREKPVARWTGAVLLPAPALGRHAPSLLGEGKRDGQTPSPTKPGAA